MKIFTNLTICGAMIILAATPALALSPEIDRVVISVADLDLATAVGARELDRRVTNAAETICDVARKHADTDVMSIDHCVQSVRSTASRDVATQVARAKERGGKDPAFALVSRR